MTDGADHRRTDVGHRPDQRFVGEWQQILDRAAAAGNDDDGHFRIRVQPVQGVHHFGHRVRALNGDLFDPELHGWPAACRVAQHVPFGR